MPKLGYRNTSREEPSALGITIRKLADIIIGTFCIDYGCALLHADRDFELMHRYLGLQVVSW